MKFRSAILAMLPLAMLAGCLSSEQPSSVTKTASAEDALFERGIANLLVDESLAVQLEKGGSLPEEFSGRGIVSAERVFPDAGEFEERHREYGLHLWYRISYGEDIAPTKARERFSSMRGVRAFEPVELVSTNSLPFNDPYLGSQWHYSNDGSGSSWLKGADINVFPVWNNYTTGREDVIVAVVDYGVDSKHEDLAGQVLSGVSYNFAIPGATVTAGEHGTHVGGTIAAINNNGKGVSGIAGGNAAEGNTGVKLMSLSIFDDRTTSQGSGANALVWAADHGAVLANNSWGRDYSRIENASERYAQARSDQEFWLQPNEGQYVHSLKSAIDYFNETAGMDGGVQTGPMAGGVCFFSAGNDAWQFGGYAAYPGVLAVGAFGPNGRRAYYSCYGPWVDIAAPGGDYNYTQILSTVPDNGYGWAQGTSMACPHATGVAALVVSYFGGPGFTRDMLVDRLIGGSNKDIDISSQSIGPMLDALGAILYGDNAAPDAVSGAEVSVLSNSSEITFDITGKDGAPAYGYLLLAGSERSVIENIAPNAIPTGVTAVAEKVPADAATGDALSVKLSGLSFETAYYLRIFGYDYNRNYSEASPLITFTTGANHAPAITPAAPVSELSLHSFETFTAEFDIEDEDGHQFEVNYTPGSEADTWYRNTLTGKYILTIAAKSVESGSYCGVITAADSYGAESKLEIHYSVLPNHPPMVTAEMENLLLTAPGQSIKIDMADYVYDEDGEILSYTVSNSAPTVIHFNPVNGILNGTVLGYGSADITVAGTDAAGESVSLSFKVLVRSASVVAGIYPNPVKDRLYIGTGAVEEDARVVISASSGAEVFRQTVKASAFNPAVIDFVKCAPGRYVVSVETGGKTVTQTVVKQ